MKFKILTLLLFLSITAFAQTQKINIKGFGEISATKIATAEYDLDFAKYGKFLAKGTINPIALEIETKIDSLKEFPGHAFYKKIDLQKVKIAIGQEGVKIEAELDTKKNFGDLFNLFNIPNPTMGVSIAVGKRKVVLEGELDFEEDPIIVNVIPDFSRFMIEKVGIGAEVAAGEGEVDFVFGFSIQNRWKPTEWDPDIQTVTAFEYSLLSNTISASISMTDKWTNPILLNKLLKPNSVIFENTAASMDWPIGAPSPSAFGFTIDKATFFDLEFGVFLSMTPADKQIALLATRNQITMNDLFRILNKGFGLNVPNLFPDNIFIKDVVILFSPNGGEVGEEEVQQGFILRGQAQFMDAISAQVNFYANFDNGFHLYYNMDAAFKAYFENLFRNDAKLKYISGELLKTFDVKKVRLEAKADMDLNMSGVTHCEFTILGQEVNFKLEGAFSAEALKNKMLEEIKKVAEPEAAAVIEAVGKGVDDAKKIVGQAAQVSSGLVKKYAELGVVKKDHMHHNVKDLLNPLNAYKKSDNYCYNHCLPTRAEKNTRAILTSSKSIIQDFHDRIIDDLVQIEGENYETTKQMREEFFLNEWKSINQKLENDWYLVWDDRTDKSKQRGYIGYFYAPEMATKGGNKYRAIVENKKQEYIALKNKLYNNLINTRICSNTGYTAVEGYTKIENSKNDLFINVEKNLNCSKIAPGWHSAMWTIETVQGTKYVKIKNRWKQTFLHVEHGKLECSNIAPGWHSAMWEIEKVAGTEYIRLKNRWKGTYIQLKEGNLVCSNIEKNEQGANWKLNEEKYPSKVSIADGYISWDKGRTLLVSENKKYNLVFQHDGNLILYKYGSIPLWATNTMNRGVGVRFEKRGFLVVHNGSQSLWVSGSHDKGGQTLNLDNNGNLTIKTADGRVIWGTTAIEYDAAAGCGTIYINGRMVKKYCNWSKNWYSISILGCTNNSQEFKAMFYDKDAGTAQIYRIDNAGNMALLQNFIGFSKNWSKISWIQKGGCHGLIKFEQADGFYELYNCDENGVISFQSKKQ